MRSGRHPLAPYPSPEQRNRELEGLAAGCLGVGRQAELVVYGTSVEGRPLSALRLAGPGSGAPKVLVCANTHGPEFIGNQVALGLIRSLIQGSPPPALVELVDRAEIWIAPCLNPDGYARTWAREGRGSLASLRHNARGVDLNRNWPLPPGERRRRLPGAGSDRPGDATYRGPEALSEPETAALEGLLAAQNFLASANLHSFMGTIFPPRVRDRGSARRYTALARSLRAGQGHAYLKIASRTFDTFTGEQEDHQHHHHGCWSVCVESFPWRASFAQHLRAPSLFWRFNPRNPQRWVDNDVPGIAAYLSAAVALGDRPRS